MSKHAFITGPTIDLTANNIETFRGAAEALRKAGIIPTFIHELFEVSQETIMRPAADRILCRELMKCDMLIMLEGWENDEISRRLVAAAREFEIETIYIVRWLKDNPNLLPNDNITH